MRNRVREQRTQRGLSQAELAAALGVSRQTVISIEGGRYLPSLPLAFAIARFFDLTVDKMFDPDDEGPDAVTGMRKDAERTSVRPGRDVGL
jgi:putative transcriptional regulator